MYSAVCDVCAEKSTYHTSLVIIICRAWHFLRERRRAIVVPPRRRRPPSNHAGLMYIHRTSAQGLLEVPFPPIINRWLVWNRRHRLFFTKTPDRRRYARARWACRADDKSTWPTISAATATTTTTTTTDAGESLSAIYTHKLPRFHSADFAHKFTYTLNIYIYGIQQCVCVCV